MKGSRTTPSSYARGMEKLSAVVSDWTGSTAAFVLALGAIVVWLITGPLFHFSDTWQLVINTTTTIITVLMVFLIQRAQNKTARATALKLNELLAALDGASNRLIDADQLSEAELDALQRHFQELVRMAKREQNVTKSHSVEEARFRHDRKQKRPRSRVPSAS